MDISQNEKTWVNFVRLFKWSSVAIFGGTLILMFIFG
jgi:hypothetical protein